MYCCKRVYLCVCCMCNAGGSVKDDEGEMMKV